LINFFIQDHPEYFLDSPSVIWIDLHTGLGPFGFDTIRYRHVHEWIHRQEKEEMIKDSVDTNSAEKAKTSCDEELSPKLDLNNFFSTAYRITSSRCGAGVFSGYDASEGMLMEYFADSYRKIVSSSNSESYNSSSNGDSNNNGSSGIFLVQEFGTIPTILVGRALILDNVLYQQHRIQASKNEKPGGLFSYRSPLLKTAFYPQSTEWRASLIRRGLALALQAMEYNKAHIY